MLTFRGKELSTGNKFIFRDKEISTVTGIGSREAPGRDLNLAFILGCIFASEGIELSSGCAPGMDSAFERGYFYSGPKKGFQGWLPGDSFNGKRKDGVNYLVLDQFMKDYADMVLRAAGVVWLGKLKPYVKDLYRRNVFQVLLKDYSKTDLVIYSAPVNKHGKPKGGTAIAVMVAESLGIPTINIGIEENRKELGMAMVKS